MEGVIPKAWEGVLHAASILPVIVKSIERVHDNKWSMEMSQHDHFEMVFMKKGSAVFEVSGQEVGIFPNDILLIKPDQPHKFRVKNDIICEFFVLSFKFIHKDRADISQVSFEDFINFMKERESGAFIYLKGHPRTEIISTLNRIMLERENSEEGAEFLSYLLIMEMFVLLSRLLKSEWENSIRGKEGKLRELMETAKGYIMDNFAQDIGLTDIAKFVFLSPNYFARAFKEAFNISPINYVLTLRIEKAKDLLTNTEMKIGEISFMVGFSNQQRFNDIFKKNTGISPTEFRKNIKRDKLNK